MQQLSLFDLLEAVDTQPETPVSHVVKWSLENVLHLMYEGQDKPFCGYAGGQTGCYEMAQTPFGWEKTLRGMKPLCPVCYPDEDKAIYAAVSVNHVRMHIGNPGDTALGHLVVPGTSVSICGSKPSYNSSGWHVWPVGGRDCAACLAVL